MGFPLVSIQWLQVLYHFLTDTIRLGGLLSLSLQLYRGARQGYPLSLALFAIAMEPVAEALHVSLLIKGLRLAWLEER